MTRRTIMLNARDNVASALADLKAGEEVTVFAPEGEKKLITLVQDIPLAHKFALQAITAGTRVIKMGLPFGIATQDIRAGEHVHVHNVTGEGMDGR